MKKDRKRKSFYDNKHRNQKWTEEPVGRPIDFADKYIDDGSGSDKYDNKRAYSKEKAAKKERKQNRIKAILGAVIGVLLICIGYTTMDVYMTRQAEPAEALSNIETDETADLTKVIIEAKSMKIDSVTLDSSVMLSAIINDAQDGQFSSVTFDVKREDGTIGYASNLASVDAYNTISSPASSPAASVKQLLSNDILPIARICCYKDNIVPEQDKTTAIMHGEKLYSDDNGNKYLNPNSPATYNYLRDIIKECYDNGITVFVLYGCDLPSDVTGHYNDGFDELAKKLNAEFKGKIKLLEEIDVEIDGKDPETGKTSISVIKENMAKLPKANKDQIYFITTSAEKDKVLYQFEKNSIGRYIIEP